MHIRLSFLQIFSFIMYTLIFRLAWVYFVSYSLHP